MESCHELVESGGISGAGANASVSLRAHLSRVEVLEGHAYLHADEVYIHRRPINCSEVDIVKLTNQVLLFYHFIPQP